MSDGNTRIAKTSSTCAMTLEFTQSGIFFATSHRKSAGYGAGGTVKRVATKACLQHPYDNHILTALQLYEFAVGHIQRMHFGFATVQEHDGTTYLLCRRNHLHPHICTSTSS